MMLSLPKALTLSCCSFLLIHTAVLASHSDKKEQCLLDLENDPFAIEMNNVTIFGDVPYYILNDRPAWTTILLSFYSIAASGVDEETDGANSAIPYGLCIPDDYGLMRCNAALVPYFLSLIPQDELSLPPFIKYFSELPYSCLEQRGTLVHTSFSTDCLPMNGIDDVEFFGIPQCIPESCNIRRANRFWKKRIESDLEELKNGEEGFPGGENCEVKFRMETEMKKKKGGKAMRKNKKKKKKKKKKKMV
eukprot:CAMPEP_0176488576 /NCGR_PEP_ID=MMETSP0200_2-20121128/6789_1 /TAXON_ID=947934 /ORGANISM="Chaetoceros sp., Strain GSL56" /LENGTH=247 /DNA_ID=CAMNT_0017885581 /DNA_START=155 /DNA_END=898 /DNA_ORIENTATION=-